MNSLLQLAAVLAMAAVSVANVVKSPETIGNFELLILHNNDMHARFEQTSQLSGACTDADRDAGKCYGGFARVAHVVKEARKAAAEGRGPPVLYLNAGDTYTGTAWFTIYKWKIAAEFINALQPDAVSLNNDDIESSELSPLLHELKTSIVSTNVLTAGSNKLQKSVIFNVEGVKVGLVGYLKAENVLDSTGNVEYIEEVIALKDEVAKLKQNNVNVIIALGHSSPEKDMEIAKEVEGIDILIGGQKNTFYWNGTSVSDAANEPLIVKQQSGKQVLVIQSQAYNKYLGNVKVEFDSGNIKTYTSENILLDTSITQDIEIAHMVEEITSELSTRSEDIVGETAVVLDGNSCRTEECNMGNLITDAMMYYYAIRFEGERWTDAAIAVIPGGAIGSSIAPPNRPASITTGDLLTALPTESHIVAVTIPGGVLLQLLEHSVASYSVSNPTGEFLQLSGIRVVYDLEKEPGSRIVTAVARCWACYVPEYYEIDDRDYKVLMPVAMANGEYGFSMLTSLPREELDYDEVTCATEFIGLRSPVYPEIGGRVDLLNVNDSEEDQSTEEDLSTEEDRDTTEEDRDTTEEDRDTTEEDRDTTEEDRDTTEEDRDTTEEDRDTTEEDRDTTEEDRDTTEEDRDTTEEDRDTTEEDRDTTEEDRDTTEEDRDTTEEDRDTTEEDRDTTEEDSDEDDPDSAHAISSTILIPVVALISWYIV